MIVNKYNYAIDMAFEYITEDKDLSITKENLKHIVEAAKKRLDNIVEHNDTEAFGIYDSYKE